MLAGVGGQHRWRDPIRQTFGIVWLAQYRIASDEIDHTAGPRQNKMIYSFEQEFPLWGKRDLRSAQASALVERSRADARQTEAELIEKVKIAFAQYLGFCDGDQLHGTSRSSFASCCRNLIVLNRVGREELWG
jgi:hypothetical protein